MSDFQGINASYAVELEEGGVSYPAIQGTTYQPRTLKEAVQLCLSADSVDLLVDPACAGWEMVECNFGDEDVPMFVIPKECRFVILGIPKVFIYDKESGEYSHPQRGVRLAGTGKVTATRLPLAVIKPDGEFILDGEGQPQIFTLKLTSSKTALLNGDKFDPEFKSIQGLNKALQAHFKKSRASLTHLVSVALGVAPKKFTSRQGDQSSIGIMFTLEGNAKPLPESAQALTFALVAQEDFKAFLADPFRLKAKTEDDANTTVEGEINVDDIDF